MSLRPMATQNLQALRRLIGDSLFNPNLIDRADVFNQAAEGLEILGGHWA